MAIQPSHVPSDRVIDFDFYNIPGSDVDVQLAYQSIQLKTPAIFWTPRNGGHWVATRAEHILFIQRDDVYFSHRRITLPLMPDTVPRQIPIELDPPEHAGFRKPLTRALLPKIVVQMDSAMRALAIELIEAVVARGTCEFIDDFAGIFPVMVFLELMNIPQSDRNRLREMAERSVRASESQERVRAFEDFSAYLAPFVQARRGEPGADLLSTLVNTEIDGNRISFDDAMSFAILVMFGGLDTVASMLGFITRFLATHDETRRELVARLGDATFLRHAIEELVRRHGVANPCRYVAKDIEMDGVVLKEGDMVLPPNLLVGIDDRLVTDPAVVNFQRPLPVKHAAFGNGIHVCPGAALARLEIQIFLEEWLKRIPDFRIKSGSRPVMATGMVNGVLKLELEWGARKN